MFNADSSRWELPSVDVVDEEDGSRDPTTDQPPSDPEKRSGAQS